MYGTDGCSAREVMGKGAEEHTAEEEVKLNSRTRLREDEGEEGEESDERCNSRWSIGSGVRLEREAAVEEVEVGEDSKSSTLEKNGTIKRNT